MINCSQHSNESRNINRKIKNMHRNTTKIKQDFTSIFVLEVFIVTHLYMDISQCYVASNCFFSFARFTTLYSCPSCLWLDCPYRSVLPFDPHCPFLLLLLKCSIENNYSIYFIIIICSLIILKQMLDYVYIFT